MKNEVTISGCNYTLSEVRTVLQALGYIFKQNKQEIKIEYSCSGENNDCEFRSTSETRWHAVKVEGEYLSEKNTWDQVAIREFSKHIKRPSLRAVALDKLPDNGWPKIGTSQEGYYSEIEGRIQHHKVPDPNQVPLYVAHRLYPHKGYTISEIIDATDFSNIKVEDRITWIEILARLIAESWGFQPPKDAA